ncbi:MAG: hypothetical protein A2170_07260 [Deltaproteobacteria bacterium RBG_13_53_10]|nr:MAG: hypothetical protein A2170_07260 [Deltaproteobacteria bacterium RBG_13_53_10]
MEFLGLFPWVNVKASRGKVLLFYPFNLVPAIVSIPMMPGLFFLATFLTISETMLLWEEKILRGHMFTLTRNKHHYIIISAGGQNA